jgi:hypothetical protein
MDQNHQQAGDISGKQPEQYGTVHYGDRPWVPSLAESILNDSGFISSDDDQRDHGRGHRQAGNQQLGGASSQGVGHIEQGYSRSRQHTVMSEHLADFDVPLKRPDGRFREHYDNQINQDVNADEVGLEFLAEFEWGMHQALHDSFRSGQVRFLSHQPNGDGFPPNSCAPARSGRKLYKNLSYGLMVFKQKPFPNHSDT